MRGLFAGGLVIAGAFTLLPGRLMHRLLFGEGQGHAHLLAIGMLLGFAAGPLQAASRTLLNTSTLARVIATGRARLALCASSILCCRSRSRSASLLMRSKCLAIVDTRLRVPGPCSLLLATGTRLPPAAPARMLLAPSD